MILGGLAFLLGGAAGGGGTPAGAILAGACNPLFFIGVPLGIYWLHRSGVFAGLSDNAGSPQRTQDFWRSITPRTPVEPGILPPPIVHKSTDSEQPPQQTPPRAPLQPGPLPPPIASRTTTTEQRLQMTYDEWYERTTGLLLNSNIPRVYIEDCLTDRPAMQELYQNGLTAAEVLMYLSKRYREQMTQQMTQRKAEAKRLNAEAREWVCKKIAVIAIVIGLAFLGVIAMIYFLCHI